MGLYDVLAFCTRKRSIAVQSILHIGEARFVFCRDPGLYLIRFLGAWMEAWISHIIYLIYRIYFLHIIFLRRFV